MIAEKRKLFFSLLSPICLDALLEAKLYMDDATMSLVLTLVLLANFLNNRMCWEGYQFVD
jgi:hypothetical protein